MDPRFHTTPRSPTCHEGLVGKGVACGCRVQLQDVTPSVIHVPLRSVCNLQLPLREARVPVSRRLLHSSSASFLFLDIPSTGLIDVHIFFLDIPCSYACIEKRIGCEAFFRL